MASLLSRIQGFWYNIDRAVNAGGGGDWNQTISGTLGRSLPPYRPKALWWGPPAVATLNALVYVFTLGRVKDHCQDAAKAEITQP